jgi:hypothetical protein
MSSRRHLSFIGGSLYNVDARQSTRASSLNIHFGEEEGFAMLASECLPEELDSTYEYGVEDVPLIQDRLHLLNELDICCIRRFCFR